MQQSIKDVGYRGWMYPEEAYTCGKRWQNTADVFYGWPISDGQLFICSSTILGPEMLVICTINTGATLLLRIITNLLKST